MRRQPEAGVTAVEVTLGTSLLLFVLLFAIQLVLFFHGALAAKAAAASGARTLALTGNPAAAQSAYDKQRATALQSLRWQGLSCQTTATAAICQAIVQVPSLIPGGGPLFGGGGAFGAITVDETGQYPTTDAGG